MIDQKSQIWGQLFVCDHYCSEIVEYIDQKDYDGQ